MEEEKEGKVHGHNVPHAHETQNSNIFPSTQHEDIMAHPDLKGVSRFWYLSQLHVRDSKNPITCMHGTYTSDTGLYLPMLRLIKAN